MKGIKRHQLEMYLTNLVRITVDNSNSIMLRVRQPLLVDSYQMNEEGSLIQLRFKVPTTTLRLNLDLDKIKYELQQDTGTLKLEYEDITIWAKLNRSFK